MKEKKQNKEDTIIHVFRTGVNECEKCQKLDGTRIPPEDWADEERMKEKGFWKQKNGEYLPHPHCKCHWEEVIENLASGRKAGTLTFYVEGEDYGKIPVAGTSFLGLEELIEKIEKGGYKPHSLSHLIIINHSGSDNTFPLGIDKYGRDWTLHDLEGEYVERLKYYLNSKSIVEIRMCKTASQENGKKTAQYFANLLGCQVRVYGGYVNPLGTRPGLINKRTDPNLKFYQRFYPDTKKQDFFPDKLDKQGK